MTAPDAAGDVRVVSQPVSAPLTRAAIFLIVTINPGPDNRAAVRSFCADLAALLRAVEFRDLEAGLSCVMGIGSDAWDPPVRRAAAGRTASVPRDPRRVAPCRLDAGRPAVPHPRKAHGPLFRGRDADHGADRPRGLAGRRGARLSLLRRPRSPGLRRRNGEPAGPGRHRRRAHRRGGCGVRRRQLRDRAEIPPRSRRMERAVHRGAGAHHRPHQAVRYRIGRFHQADVGAQRAHDHRRGRQGVPDPARQHAVRPGRAGRIRHLLHRLLPHAPHHRADAREHVRRDARPAITTGCSTSAAPSPEPCSSCRPRRSWSRSTQDEPAAEAPAAAPAPAEIPQPVLSVHDGSLGIGSLKGDIRHE